RRKGVARRLRRGRLGMRRLLLFAALAALSLISANPKGDTPPEKAVQQERQRMQGEWKTLIVEHAGQKKPAKEIKEWVLVVKDSQMTGKDGELVQDVSTFDLDLTQKPKVIRITYIDGPDKGHSMAGIYELDGDKLKICMSETGKE